MRALAMFTLLALISAPVEAFGDDEPPPPKPRPLRLSFGGGTGFLLTGQGDGKRLRGDAHLDISPGGRFGRFGFTGALRHIVLEPFFDDALVTGGLLYEAAAARPRLILSLHADVGATVKDHAPAFGGGLQTHLWLVPKWVPPLALALDVTAHVVLDGLADTRLVIASATRLTLAF